MLVDRFMNDRNDWSNTINQISDSTYMWEDKKEVVYFRGHYSAFNMTILHDNIYNEMHDSPLFQDILNLFDPSRRYQDYSKYDLC
jgi:hypothetical protein